MNKNENNRQLKFHMENIERESLIIIETNDKDQEKNSAIKDSDFMDTFKKSKFWKMYLKRKAGLKAMDENVEDLVKECHFWKSQLDALEDTNSQLKLEQRFLKQDYEEMLHKTRHDTGIIFNLKDSEGRFVQKRKEYSRLVEKLEISDYVNTDRSTDRMLLENEKRELLQKLKTNNNRLAKLNRIHKGIQDSIAEQKKVAEGNEKRYGEELSKLQKSSVTNEEACEEVKKKLSERESAFEGLENLMTNGLKVYLKVEEPAKEENKDKNLETVHEEQHEEIPEDKSQISLRTEVELTSTTQDANDSPNKDAKAKEVDNVNNPPKGEEVFDDELKKSEFLLTVAQQENAHLQLYYSFLTKRMKELNDVYIEKSVLCNLKEMELKKLSEKASNLYQLVTKKRKKFSIPPRNRLDELKIKIESEIRRSEAYRQLLPLFLDWNMEDFQFQIILVAEVEDIYREALRYKDSEEEKKTANGAENTPNEADNASNDAKNASNVAKNIPKEAENTSKEAK